MDDLSFYTLLAGGWTALFGLSVVISTVLMA
jgi:hypothetical protein